MVTEPTQVLLQGFRAVFVATMEISATLALAVAGGVRQRTIPITLGTATWTAFMAMYSVPTSVSLMGFLCVV